MDNSKFQADILPILSDAAGLLSQANGEIRSTNSIVLIESEGLFPELLSAVNRLIRKLPQGNGIDLILHSLGGTTDTAAAIASLCRVRFGSFRVVVPFLAKSAATLLALAADERLLSTSGQLGPVDPQVLHPEKQVWFPAHSIREALERVEATKDPLVKVAMADKLDPFLIGAYEDAIRASKQYIEQAIDNWKGIDKTAIVDTFIEKYKSHGYPIDCRVLTSIGVPHTALPDKAEQLLGDLHEKCVDILDEYKDMGSIILTKDEYLFRLGEFRAAGKFATPVQLPLPTAIAATPVP
jgi:hypothetical protein